MSDKYTKLAKNIQGPCAISCSDEELNICLENENKVYVCKADEKEIKEFLEGNKTIICYDCKSLYKKFGVNNFAYFDVMLGAYVLEPSGNFDISRLVAQYLGEVYSPDTPDAYYIMQLYKAIYPEIESRGQHNLMFNIEMPLAGVLADMETYGFRIDVEGLARYSDMLGKLEKEAEERIFVFAGTEFNVNSPKQLSEVLFDKLMIPPPGKKTKTGYSTNADVLEKLAPEQPIIRDILEYRTLAKLKSTYAEGLLVPALKAVLPLLSDYAIVVCEHPPEVELPESITDLSIYRTYRYGKVLVTVYRKGEDK